MSGKTRMFCTNAAYRILQQILPADLWGLQGIHTIVWLLVLLFLRGMHNFFSAFAQLLHRGKHLRVCCLPSKSCCRLLLSNCWMSWLLYPTPSSAATIAPVLAPANLLICFQTPDSSRTCKIVSEQVMTRVPFFFGFPMISLKDVVSGTIFFARLFTSLQNSKQKKTKNKKIVFVWWVLKIPMWTKLRDTELVNVRVYLFLIGKQRILRAVRCIV